MISTVRTMGFLRRHAEAKTQYRWENHPGTLHPGGYRKQSIDDHRRELLEMAMVALCVLRSRGFNVDESLVLSAVWLHDDGELLGAGDTLYALKCEGGDVEEFRLFSAALEKVLDPISRAAFGRAFLLQFVRKYAGSTVFPCEAQATIDVLSKTRPLEAALFQYLEYADYLLYAHEQYVAFGNPEFVREVLPNTQHRLRGLWSEYELFRGLLLDEHTLSECEELVERLGPLKLR